MRLPIEKILVPTDFSDPSKEAAKAAKDLAVALEAELILVHVVSAVPPFPGNIAPNAPGFNIHMYQKDLITHWGKELDNFARRFSAEGNRVRSVVLDGDPGKNIVELAEQEGVDLVVIATQGRTGLRRFVFGSVAEKVIRHSPCPVLVLPAHRFPSPEKG